MKPSYWSSPPPPDVEYLPWEWVLNGWRDGSIRWGTDRLFAAPFFWETEIKRRVGVGLAPLPLPDDVAVLMMEAAL
jgi:hypothetical protein